MARCSTGHHGVLCDSCVGGFYPAAAVIRSKILPPAVLSTIMNLFRVPLNIIVASGTKMTDLLAPGTVFMFCVSCHIGALACQMSLVRFMGETEKRKKTKKTEKGEEEAAAGGTGGISPTAVSLLVAAVGVVAALAYAGLLGQ